jgi:NADPH:quinone reductase-like Zn-dependent oxidoreductase
MATVNRSGSRKIRAVVQRHDGKKSQPEQFHEDLSQLLVMLQEKLIRPVVAERMPLREAARAHELLERASVSGKMVLMCQE